MSPSLMPCTHHNNGKLPPLGKQAWRSAEKSAYLLNETTNFFVLFWFISKLKEMLR